MLSQKSIQLFGDWAPCKKVTSCSFEGFPIINIEGPISSNNTETLHPSPKAGPSLSHSTFPDFHSPGVAVLANNHLFDFGRAGYESTLRLINLRKWHAVGAGVSKADACQPVVFQWSGKRIGVIARCETQFGIAQEGKPGVAAFDPTVYEQIRNLKRETDLVIASIHAAAEMLPWPSPRRQDTWRALIDAGADIVHGHHAHVPQGWEEYKNGFIFYGLGNFCVDPDKWSWHPNGLWSLVPQITVLNNEIQIQIKTAVIEDRAETINVHESSEEEYAAHLDYLEICNRPLGERLLLEGLWQEASVRMYVNYYADWLGFRISTRSKLLRSLKSAAGTLKRRLLDRKTDDQTARKKHLLHYHLFACESHNEAISTALGVLGGGLEDLRNIETKRLVDRWVPNR